MTFRTKKKQNTLARINEMLFTTTFIQNRTSSENFSIYEQVCWNNRFFFLLFKSAVAMENENIVRDSSSNDDRTH